MNSISRKQTHKRQGFSGHIAEVWNDTRNSPIPDRLTIIEMVRTLGTNRGLLPVFAVF